MTVPAAEELAALWGRLNRAESELEVVTELVGVLITTSGLRTAGSGTAPGPPGQGPYSSVADWVTGHFAAVYSRPVSPTTRWCASWWDHAEAVSRLEALHRTWEAARGDPVRGMADWYRDCDHQLAVLTSPTGPFSACTPDRHAPPRPLPLLPAPESHFDPPDQPAAPTTGGVHDTDDTVGGAGVSGPDDPFTESRSA